VNRRTPRAGPAVVAVSLAGVLLTGAGCGGSTPNRSAASSTPGPSATSAGGSTSEAGGGLGGGSGERSSTPRSTIVTTPTPTISTSAAGQEIGKPCPYLTDLEWADHEGNRVGRSVQLAGTPVGCRFYFAYDPNQITGEILIQRFGTATEAFNAVVIAARGHPEFVDDRSIGDGGSISVRLPLQGAPTWACVFSHGRSVVTVHTSQNDTSNDARTLARLVSGRLG
jgi:hypothetical protein